MLVRGSAERNSTERGRATPPSRSRQNATSSSAVTAAARTQDDGRVHRLAPPRVGHADHGRLGDRRVRAQRLLDDGR